MAREWSVYEHIFPNGKRYIGISIDPKKRWNGGIGYDTQPKMANAVKKYGWDNIQHHIIMQGLTEEQAKDTEMFFIQELDTIENGYNTDVGGGTIFSFYLSTFLLDMIRGVRRIAAQHPEAKPDGVPLWESVYADRKSKNASENWNLLSGEALNLYLAEESNNFPSATDDWDVSRFWGCFAYIVDDYYCYINGKDRKPYIHATQVVENTIFCDRRQEQITREKYEQLTFDFTKGGN